MSRKQEILKLYPAIAELLKSLSNNLASIFHYKDDNQIAALYPNLDTDGAVLFGLNALERIHAQQLLIRDQPVTLEIILGYATIDVGNQDLDDALFAAENLLELQKL